MKKAPDAFRTISEVSDILNTPAHVLRFWESKFYQIRPVKRAGGRRYYRPDDVALINGVRHLLQDQGMTIRGVQRILQENGIKHVVALGTPVPSITEAVEDAIVDAVAVETTEPKTPSQAPLTAVLDQLEDAQVIEEAPAAPTDEQPSESSDAVSDASAARDTAPSDAEPPTPQDQVESEPPADDAPAEPVEAEPLESEPVLPEPLEPEEPPAPEIVAVETDAPAPTPVVAKEPTAPESTPSVSASEPKLPKGKDDMTTVDLPEIDPTSRTDDAGTRPSLASQLRAKPRGELGADADRYARVSRRIEALLDRMSEASGAGRW